MLRYGRWGRPCTGMTGGPLGARGRPRSTRQNLGVEQLDRHPKLVLRLLGAEFAHELRLALVGNEELGSGIAAGARGEGKVQGL
jgi:hypothetical protein